MNSLFLLPFLLLHPEPDSVCYEKIIHDLDTYGYYISVEVKVGQEQFWVSIENSELYVRYLRDHLVKDRYEYYDFMRCHKGKVIPVNNPKIEKFRVYFNDTIMADAEKGKEYFIKKYLPNQFFSKNVNEKYYPLIIKILYEKWCILGRITDESGEWIIEPQE